MFFDYPEQVKTAPYDLAKWIEQGRIDATEGEDVHEARFEDVPSVYQKLFEGKSKGKLITSLIL